MMTADRFSPAVENKITTAMIAIIQNCHQLLLLLPPNQLMSVRYRTEMYSRRPEYEVQNIVLK